ncbi:MAG: prenyltransferase, partial [Deltaproteobacteria bacterium]|nr:prenyltransferase [Deltaproteobacteria bacterium]
MTIENDETGSAPAVKPDGPADAGADRGTDAETGAGGARETDAAGPAAEDGAAGTERGTADAAGGGAGDDAAPDAQAPDAQAPDAQAPDAGPEKTVVLERASAAKPENVQEEGTSGAGAAAAGESETSSVPAAARLGALWPSVKAWWQASRPAFFIVTLYPLFLGYIAARRFGDAEPSCARFALILIASFLVHLAANISNDYFEHRGGVDTQGSIGGSRVIQEGKLSPRAIRQGMLFCYAVSFALAILIVQKNWALWGMVVFAALSSFLYVAPPVKYGHRGLGELMVFLNMGVIMTAGTFMALAGPLRGEVLALSLPGSFMVANILFYQSLPEIETDRAAGKTTVAGLLGKERAALTELLWWPLVWLLVVTLVLCGKLSVLALLCLLAIPLHTVSMRRIWTASDWLKLDSSGHLVKLLYVWTGLAVLAGAYWNPFPAEAEAQPPVLSRHAPPPPAAPAAAVPPAAPAAPADTVPQSILTAPPQPDAPV